MNDPIIQEVREARAAIAAEFNYDIGKYLAWIREQTAARKRREKANPEPATAGQPAGPRRRARVRA